MHILALSPIKFRNVVNPLLLLLLLSFLLFLLIPNNYPEIKFWHSFNDYYI